jgi:hypothetical protein
MISRLRTINFTYRNSSRRDMELGRHKIPVCVTMSAPIVSKILVRHSVFRHLLIKYNASMKNLTVC